MSGPERSKSDLAGFTVPMVRLNDRTLKCQPTYGGKNMTYAIFYELLQSSEDFQDLLSDALAAAANEVDSDPPPLPLLAVLGL